MNFYKNKYLKYKNKYLKLKKIIGGNHEKEAQLINDLKYCSCELDFNNLISFDDSFNQNFKDIKERGNYVCEKLKYNVEIIDKLRIDNGYDFYKNFNWIRNKIKYLCDRIIAGNFSSLYEIQNNELCLSTKLELSDIINYISIFNELCNLKDNNNFIFPKMTDFFYLYRSEYINEDSLFMIEKEKYNYIPFSCTWCFNFALEWLLPDVNEYKLLYVIKVPHNCNYLFIYDQKQKEVTLQQGIFNIKKMTDINYKNDIKVKLVECDFEPIDKINAINKLEKLKKRKSY